MTNERFMAKDNHSFPSYIKWKAKIEDAVMALGYANGYDFKHVDRLEFDYLSRYKDKVTIDQAAQDLFKVAKEHYAR